VNRTLKFLTACIGKIPSCVLGQYPDKLKSITNISFDHIKSRLTKRLAILINQDEVILLDTLLK